MDSHRLDLMTRLCLLDAALASRHERAIAVAELGQVWDLHQAQFEGVAEGDMEWVEALLRTLARRHGIFGLVRLPGPAAARSKRDGSAEFGVDREGDIIAPT